MKCLHYELSALLFCNGLFEALLFMYSGKVFESKECFLSLYFSYCLTCSKPQVLEFESRFRNVRVVKVDLVV